MKATMRHALLSFVIALICAAAVVHGDEKNINKLLNNQVIVSRQIMCVLEKSPCDQLGRQLKGKSIACCCCYFLVFFLILF